MSKLKRTTEEVRKYFAERGCELLGEYIGVQKKMKYRCVCGNISEIDYNHFSQGKRCGMCNPNHRRKKYTLEEVKIRFAECGCEFLDDHFDGIKQNHNYRCKCGRISRSSFMAIYHHGSHCKECGLEKVKGPLHHAWQEDRELLALNRKFKKKCYKALQSSLNATGKKKVGRTTDMLGYSPEEMQSYIMTHLNWDSVKDDDWTIDHIFPIAAFVEHEIYDIKLINSLDNLRPITRKENSEKWATYDRDEFKKWLKSHLSTTDRIHLSQSGT